MVSFWRHCLQTWKKLASFLKCPSISILGCRQQWQVSVHFSGYWQEKYSISFWFWLMQRHILVIWSFAAPLKQILLIINWVGGVLGRLRCDVWGVKVPTKYNNMGMHTVFLSSRVNLSNGIWPLINFFTTQNIHMYFHVPFCLQARIFLNLPLALFVFWLFLWKN